MFNGLIISCPIGQEHENCPFAEVRRKKFVERGAYLENLPLMKRVRMHKEHIMCLRKKEKDSSAIDGLSYSL